MIHDLDNPPFAPDPRCPSCKRPWIEHPGLTDTCAELQRYKALLAATNELLVEHIDLAIQLKTTLAAAQEPPQTPK